MIISAMFIFSTTGGTEITRGVPWYLWTATRQVIAFGMGLFVVLGLSLVDYSRMARWAMVGYWVSIALLLAVHILGTSRNGARRWLDLGPIQFQPSELAKLTFLFAMANFLARPRRSSARPASSSRPSCSRSCHWASSSNSPIWVHPSYFCPSLWS